MENNTANLNYKAQSYDESLKLSSQQLSELRSDVNKRLKELNHSDSESAYKELSKQITADNPEISLRWESIRTFVENDTSESRGSYKKVISKLSKAFTFVRLNRIDRDHQLIAQLGNKNYQGLINTYAIPESEPLSQHKDSILSTLESIDNFFLDSWKANQKTLKESIELLSDLEDKFTEFFETLKEKGIIIYCGGVPLYMQPPEELYGNDEPPPQIRSLYVAIVSLANLAKYEAPNHINLKINNWGHISRRT